MPSTSQPHRLRRLAVLARDSWLARSYLVVFGVSLVAMFLFPDSPFAAVPLLLTAPLCTVALFLPLDPGSTVEGAADFLALGAVGLWLAVCALVNACVLGAVTTRPATPRTPAASASRPGTETPPRRVMAEQDGPRGLRGVLAPALDNWLARGYLAVVAAALGFFLYAAYVQQDAGFAAIWPVMATAPFSPLALLLAGPAEYYSALPWLGSLILLIGVTLSGLINAVLLGRLARRLHGSEPRPAMG
ncbi:SCO4225 family membrane protein [Streptomyces fructofermentans]|uniref:Uncharacterized protein n=1 Tax=Streptomyces fructofermentans TaxID=152141 RepID=A0A918K355_9ACTN|nr:hypothetical protein [Streptomyces fructofermentans]GGX46092.1 hypothetical protein GCM10010515_11100 [Streptomyces fructofermentans]